MGKVRDFTNFVFRHNTLTLFPCQAIIIAQPSQSLTITTDHDAQAASAANIHAHMLHLSDTLLTRPKNLIQHMIDSDELEQLINLKVRV
jgi:hypothetical protein